MIELGLSRISQLLKNTPLPWKAIHVAGTNGKGTICMTASAMIAKTGISHGRFTSPHLVDRWDCININEEPVAEAFFREVENVVLNRNKTEGINATEFELLTATAFEIFTRAQIQIGVIETGMGGRLDSTNILRHPLVTVISKIGLDHTNFLGDTIELIAAEKAGILKPGVPCIIEGTNKPSVIQIIKNRAREISAGPVYEIHGFPDTASSDKAYQTFLHARPYQSHEILNLACAHRATLIALEAISRKPTNELSLFHDLEKISWPGRLQSVSLSHVTGRKTPVLVDGAHNPDSAEALADYVSQQLRKQTKVVWVLSVSYGKDMEQMLRPLLCDGDTVVAVEFGPVDGMPWVKSTPAKDVLAAAARTVSLDKSVNCGKDVLSALKTAMELASVDGVEAPMVVAGSLYLVSDVSRLLREG